MTASIRPLAVVTGASSGIGLELAKQFTENGFDLLICAENDAIHVAGTELETAGAVVEVVQADLATYDGVEELVSRIQFAGRPEVALALNAGVGVAGEFVGTELDDDLRLLQLNIASVVHLTKRVLPSMIERGAGRLLFTASVASTMPGPYYATYAASKAFVLSFAEAIRYEVKDSGVTVTALLPGPTDTEFFERADMLDTPAGKMDKDDPADVARDGFKALMAGDDHVVAGLKNKAQVVAGKVLSEAAKAAMHAKLTKPEDVS